MLANVFFLVYNDGMVMHDDDKIKQLIASNITYYRKECHLTQAELADKIHYSDKSISKWERGDGVPDVCVLVALAELFGVTVNDMLSEKHKKSRKAAPKLKHSIITLMSIGGVWLIATIVFFLLRLIMPELSTAWLAFILAIPASFIVGTTLSAIWHPMYIQFLMQSGLIWGLALTLHLSIRIENMYLIYTIAAVMQILFILWYILRKVPVIAVKINGGRLLIGKKSNLQNKEDVS